MFIIGNNGSSVNRFASLFRSGVFAFLSESKDTGYEGRGIMTCASKLYRGSRKKPYIKLGAANPAKAYPKGKRGTYAFVTLAIDKLGVLTRTSFLPKSIQHTLKNQLEMRKGRFARVWAANIDETSSRNREVALNTLIDFFVFTTVG